MGQYDLPNNRPRMAVRQPPQVPFVAPPVIAAGGGSPAEGGVPGMDPLMVRQAFLKSLAKGEAPPGAYDYIVGGQRFSDYSQHPGVMGTAGKYGSSTAAGQYQFLKSTWDEQAKKYGYKDFKPETQDTAAWNYAKDVYKQKSGRDLQEDLMSGDPGVINNISKTLGQTWTSLPGGSQPNSNWKDQQFADVYNKNLSGDPTDATKQVADGSDTASTTTSTSKDADTEAKDEKKKKKSYGEVAGDAIGDLGKLYAEGPVAKNAARASGPTNVAAPSMPIPQGPTPMVDTKRAEAQRQMLAMAMQRLNSGRLS